MPMDPAAMGGGLAGMPMDPSMMDPSMMDPAAAGGGAPPMDPAEAEAALEADPLMQRINKVLEKVSRVETILAHIADAMQIQMPTADILKAGENAVEEGKKAAAATPQGVADHGFSSHDRVHDRPGYPEGVGMMASQTTPGLSEFAASPPLGFEAQLRAAKQLFSS